MENERHALGRGQLVEHDQERHADRLIQGDPCPLAGPGGAAFLTQPKHHGVEIRCYLRIPTAISSRASVVYSHTLKVLEPYGVAQRLASQGIHARRFTSTVCHQAGIDFDASGSRVLVHHGVADRCHAGRITLPPGLTAPCSSTARSCQLCAWIRMGRRTV
jgi:hypothetical protein